MSNRFFKLLILLFLVAQVVQAQDRDSVVVFAEGKVYHAETREPITARITFQSLPYGSRIGVFTNSSYSFPMFEHERYSITVEADGFAPAKYLLDPGTANAENKVIQHIELTAGAPKPTHQAGNVMLLNNLIFEVGRAKVSRESYDELEIVVKMMNENPGMVIQLEGHTDYQGDPKDNLKLSQQRVNAVKEYLVGRGVKSGRVKTKAFGGSMPLSRDDTPEAHRMNRRVELRILENN